MLNNMINNAMRSCSLPLVLVVCAYFSTMDDGIFFSSTVVPVVSGFSYPVAPTMRHTRNKMPVSPLAFTSSSHHRHYRASSSSGRDRHYYATDSDGSSSKPSGGGDERNPMKIYVEYLRRLWDETSLDSRRKVAKGRARGAIRLVQQMFQTEDYLDEIITDGGSTAAAVEARAAVLESCDKMLHVMDYRDGTTTADGDGAADVAVLDEELQAMLQAEGIAQLTPDTAVAADTTTAQDTTLSPPAMTRKENVVENTNMEEEPMQSLVPTTLASEVKKKKKPRRSILFGWAMGAVVAGWVFSGNYIFTGLFTFMTVLGQLEYYRMVMNAGIYPARRISVVGACAMFVTALFFPSLHQVVLPTFATMAMIWFLTMRRQTSTISDIATTFTGMFYLGYIPSFWVRTRLIGFTEWDPTRIAPLVKPLLDMIGHRATTLPSFIPKTIHLPITAGSVFIFWTWLCIAFADVGAYFAGRYFGKTKLGAVCPAAGATSPNKTVEGLIGGCALSAVLATLGAWVMKWPAWAIVGPLHGINLALLGLVGDLTASMLKRDAGLKDFGDLIPEHGGIMDRVDSFIFTAPYSWLMCGTIIPWLKLII